MKFCNICGARKFTAFNGRVDARCENCESLERHRSLALCLLSLPLSEKRRICVLGKSSRLPKYFKYLSPLHGSFEAVNVNNMKSRDEEFDVLIHDHLLHDAEEVLGINNYFDLVRFASGMLRSGGIQVFTLGKLGDLSLFFHDTVVDFASNRDFLFEPANFGEYPPKGKVMLFNPFSLFGSEISEQTKIGYTISGLPNGNSTLCCLKE